MKDFIASSFLGDFAKALATDIESVDKGKFDCCPVIGRTKESRAIVGRFNGKIGLPNINDFKEAMRELLHEDMEKIILDFHSVSLTRTAVGALVDFTASVHGYNRRLYIFRPSDQVMGLLSELELAPFFRFLHTEDDVLMTLAV